MKKNIFKNDEWKYTILQAGRQGRHLTYFLDLLEISFAEHDRLLGLNKNYSNTVKEYEKLCEEYWFNLAHRSMVENNGAGFNTRLWTVIMKNKFSERWTEANRLDLTTNGEKINTITPIQIEVVKKIDK